MVECLLVRSNVVSVDKDWQKVENLALTKKEVGLKQELDEWLMQMQICSYWTERETIVEVEKT